MQIGAQLFTVSDFTKNLNDFAETLKRVTDIGYKNVQVSGTCPYEPQWLKEQLEANGLKCVLTHTPADRIEKQPEQVANDHRIFGCSNVGIGWYNVSECGVDAFYDRFIKSINVLRQNNMRLLYHNHDHEFEKQNGKTILQQMAERFSKDELGFTLDTYWVQAGGGDPIWWINYLKGRVPCVHLKDMAYGRKMMVVGEGNMNFEGILKSCVDAGTEYALVEQDDYNGENPFDCLKRSYEYLKSRGFN